MQVGIKDSLWIISTPYVEIYLTTLMSQCNYFLDELYKWLYK